jgi:hypothetical protein
MHKVTKMEQPARRAGSLGILGVNPMKAVKFVGMSAVVALIGGSFLSLTAGGQTAAPAPAAATTAPATDNVEAVRQQLITLQKMLDEKLIDPKEYDAAREKLLASIGAVPAPAPAPAPALTPAPAPPPAAPVSLLPTFAGRWTVQRTRVDTFDGQIIQTPENPFTWIVTVLNGAVTISREEEFVRFGHHPTVELTPVDVGGAQVTGNTLKFVVTQTGVGHEHTTVMTYTYQLQLGAVDKIAGTFTLDMETTEPHGIVKSQESGNVQLVRLPG